MRSPASTSRTSRSSATADQPVRMLSGGNIQKVVVAREFTSGANFILANQPTRGIDVGTAEMIRKTIVRKSREEGTATLLISADLNEVLECSDRLLVMHKGQDRRGFPPRPTRSRRRPWAVHAGHQGNDSGRDGGPCYE